MASAERLTVNAILVSIEKVATQPKERRLPARRSLGEGGAAAEFKIDGCEAVVLDRSATGYNCLVTILLLCSTKIPSPN